MRYIRLFALTALIAAAASFTAFAGQWKRDNRGWWYQNENGSYPKAKWKKIDNVWYYFHADGYMAYHTWIGNYYLSDSGAMLKNAYTPDGYRVGADGAWVRPNNSIQPSDLPLSREPFDGYTIVVDIGTKKLHRPGCKEIKNIPSKNLRYSEIEVDLLNAGFTYCPYCH